MTPILRLRAYSGPALLSYGFRPFFLFGSIYAGLAVLAWLPVFYGELSVATTFIPRDWHIHEMIYGYVAAVMTGFLLTAIPNWTGRLPIQGTPLLFLVALWLTGRIAITTSTYIGWLPAAIIDVSFLLRCRLGSSFSWFWYSVWTALAGADYGIRLGIAAAITAIMVNFHRNSVRRSARGCRTCWPVLGGRQHPCWSCTRGQDSSCRGTQACRLSSSNGRGLRCLSRPTRCEPGSQRKEQRDGSADLPRANGGSLRQLGCAYWR